MSNFDLVEKVMCIGSDNTSPIQFYKRGFNLRGSASPSWQDIILSGNTALTLTNALANGLNYLKLFGGTEQRNIPSEYTQVEYLGGTRNAYANLGAITIEPTDTLYCECILPDNGKILFGSSDHTRCYIAQSGNGTSAFVGTSYPVPLETWIIDGTTVNTIELTSSKFTINGVDFTPTGTASSDICSSFGINTIINATSGYDTSVSYIKKFYIKSSSGNYKVNLTSCRNTNNVFGYYDTVTGNFLTNQGTDTFIAGADVTAPSPDAPMDIICNNGVVKVSKNLYDINTRTQGYYIDASGNLAALVVSAVSDYIPCNSNSQYVLSGICGNPQSYSSNNKRIHCYDENKNWIAQLSSMEINIGTPFTISVTTPSNARYLRVSAFSSDINTQLEQGSTATPYRPYGQIYVDGTVETVEVTGKNLFDYEYFYDNYQMYSPSAVGRCPIKLQPNTTYTVSTNKEVYSSSASMFVVSGNAIDWAPNTSNNGVLVNSPRTVTTDSNGYLCLGIYVQGDNAVPESNFESGTVWVQIEQGSTATTYEPYTVLGSATAEMLLKVGDYQDVQSVLDGSVTKNVEVKVLDGTENWEDGGGSTFYITLMNMEQFKNISCLCSHFLGVSTSTSLSRIDFAIRCGYHITSSVAYNRLYIKDTTVSNVNDLKSWLASQYANGTPVIVVYPTSSPTTETVTAQPLTTQAGTNIVEITQASIDNLELEVSYKATV
jgi:hypothetical protein